jgi:hypothetical protein
MKIRFLIQAIYWYQNYKIKHYNKEKHLTSTNVVINLFVVSSVVLTNYWQGWISGSWCVGRHNDQCRVWTWVPETNIIQIYVVDPEHVAAVNRLTRCHSIVGNDKKGCAQFDALKQTALFQWNQEDYHIESRKRCCGLNRLCFLSSVNLLGIITRIWSIRSDISLWYVCRIIDCYCCY